MDAAQVLQEAMDELDSMIGLDGVKAMLKDLVAHLEIEKERQEEDGLPSTVESLHLVFTGNPGTGKTTVARIIGQILYGLDVLKTPKLVECKRDTLVGGVLGETAIKTAAVIDSALDGVLFIDEAYTLAKDIGGHQDPFGSEAIETLLTGMEDHRDRLVVIVAGYPERMSEFLQSNPGLESRFEQERRIYFEDYTPQDMQAIFERFCHRSGRVLDTGARSVLQRLLSAAYARRDEHFGNARFVREVFGAAVRHLNRRLNLLPKGKRTKSMRNTLTGCDIPLELAGPASHVSCPSCKASCRRLPGEISIACLECGLTLTLNADGELFGVVVECPSCEHRFMEQGHRLVGCPECTLAFPISATGEYAGKGVVSLSCTKTECDEGFEVCKEEVAQFEITCPECGADHPCRLCPACDGVWELDDAENWSCSDCGCGGPFDHGEWIVLRATCPCCGGRRRTGVTDRVLRVFGLRLNLFFTRQKLQTDWDQSHLPGM